MNIHPVRAVGVLPEFHPDMSADFYCDTDMDEIRIIDFECPHSFPFDPVYSCSTTCVASSYGSSSEDSSFDNAFRVGDDALDNIITRCLEIEPDDVTTRTGTGRDSVSVEDALCRTTTTEKQSDQIVMDGAEMIAPAARANPHMNPHIKNGSRSQAVRGKIAGVRKEKRSRAPARPWTEYEHQRFEQSLELFGRNWEQCAAYIGTRRAQLVRSHAQKHLIKLWKLGKPLPKKVAESGTGYTLSGKPLLADSASARSYLTKIPCPDITN